MAGKKIKSFEEEDRKLIAGWERDIEADRITLTPLSKQARAEIGKAASRALKRSALVAESAYGGKPVKTDNPGTA